MSDTSFNKFRAAAQVLQRGRDLLVESLAEDVLDQADDLIDNNFLFNEFLESQGTRLHFLMLVLSQLEQSADSFDELAAIQPPPKPAEPAKKKRTRAKKLPQKASTEGTSDEI
jgi:hypothetical protein